MAHALKFHAVVSGKTLTLSDLSAEDDPLIDLDAASRSRPLGIMRGQFVVPDDFNDPLPPELQKYFEGGEDKS
jgi:hypothetical protein